MSARPLALCGVLAALAVVNATSSFTGVELGLNLFNALVVGVLGAPGLVLLILFNLLGMFFRFGGVERLLCFGGAAIFLVFTAYDVQKIKALHAACSHDAALLEKASIFAALQLYLDFINLFLYILRLFNSRD